MYNGIGSVAAKQVHPPSVQAMCVIFFSTHTVYIPIPNIVLTIAASVVVSEKDIHFNGELLLLKVTLINALRFQWKTTFLL